MGLNARKYRLESLVQWENIEMVNEMLRKGITPTNVAKWCTDNGFSISHSKMAEYKNMLFDALSKDITIEAVLGIGIKREPILFRNAEYLSSMKKATSDIQILDEIIQKGFNSLANAAHISLHDAMKAMEMKNRITKGGLGGLTMHGLDQLRELESCKFEAVLEVVRKYVPKENLQELEVAIEEAERQFYEENAPHLLQVYEEENGK